MGAIANIDSQRLGNAYAVGDVLNLEIFGDIEAEGSMLLWFGMGVDASALAKCVRQYGSSFNEIRLHIDTNGGDVRAGTNLYTALLPYRDKIKCFLYGKCSSMGTILACSARPENVFMSELGSFFVHPVQMVAYGDGNDLIDIGNFANNLTAQAAKIYSDHTGKSQKEIASLLKQSGSWLTAPQAKEAGFVGTIMSAADADSTRALVSTESEAAKQLMIEGTDPDSDEIGMKNLSTQNGIEMSEFTTDETSALKRMAAFFGMAGLTPAMKLHKPAAPTMQQVASGLTDADFERLGKIMDSKIQEFALKQRIENPVEIPEPVVAAKVPAPAEPVKLQGQEITLKDAKERAEKFVGSPSFQGVLKGATDAQQATAKQTAKTAYVAALTEAGEVTDDVIQDAALQAFEAAKASLSPAKPQQALSLRQLAQEVPKQQGASNSNDDSVLAVMRKRNEARTKAANRF